MRMKIGLAGLALVLLGSAVAHAEPIKIRVAWVAPISNWMSMWLDKKDLAQHYGKSYTFEAVHFAGTPPMVTALTLGATPAFHVVKLHAPVLSALPTPDGKFAVVLHPADAAPDAGVADADAGAPAAPPPARAFSLLPLDGTQPPRIEMTDAPVRAVAISPASDSVLLTVRGDEAPPVYGAYLGLLPSLKVDRYPLASPPIAAGVVGGANRGYIAQQHPEGRITFLSLDSGDARTLTGYELGARVVEWSR